MVVGSGLIANSLLNANPLFSSTEKIIFFASGVSNSKENNLQAYRREKDLLVEIISQNKNANIVYFSTSSIDLSGYNIENYIQHKIDMEDIISQKSKGYNIIRLPQVVGHGGNPNTLVNYFYSRISEQAAIEIQKDSIRYLLDIDDIPRILDKIFFQEHNYVIKNMLFTLAPSKSIKVLDIVNKISTLLNSPINMTTINSSNPIKKLNTDSFLQKILDDKDPLINENYNEIVLEKYITHKLNI